MFVVVAHAEDLNYLFVLKAVNQTVAEDSADMKTWRRMVRLWTNYIKYGFVFFNIRTRMTKSCIHKGLGGSFGLYLLYDDFSKSSKRNLNSFNHSLHRHKFPLLVLGEWYGFDRI